MLLPKVIINLPIYFDHGGQTSSLRRRYYSAQACAQTLFPHSLTPMERQTDTTGDRSGEAPLAIRAFLDTGV